MLRDLERSSLLVYWLVEALIEAGTVRLPVERPHHEQQHAEEFHADNVGP